MLPSNLSATLLALSCVLGLAACAAPADEADSEEAADAVSGAAASIAPGAYENAGATLTITAKDGALEASYDQVVDGTRSDFYTGAIDRSLTFAGDGFTAEAKRARCTLKLSPRAGAIEVTGKCNGKAIASGSPESVLASRQLGGLDGAYVCNEGVVSNAATIQVSATAAGVTLAITKRAGEGLTSGSMKASWRESAVTALNDTHGFRFVRPGVFDWSVSRPFSASAPPPTGGRCRRSAK